MLLRRLSPILAAALLIATSAVAAMADGRNQETGVRAIGRSYAELITVLNWARNKGLDSSSRGRIATAAREFQDVLAHDGGARANLSADAGNIIVSLDDGTFSASGSIAALRRDFRGNLVEIGTWQPSLDGNSVPDSIGTVMNQRNEGDCVGISVIKAFSTTPAGDAILRKIVRRKLDHSFTVTFPGNSSTLFRLQSSGLDQYGKGDPAAAAVIGAMFEFFHLDPAKGALPTNKVMELLAGDLGVHDRLADAEATPNEIADFLRRSAYTVGKSTAMVFGGKPGKNGEWTKGDGHAFAIIRINASSGIVTYTNPWNEVELRTIAIDGLAQQAAGTSADFESVTFR